MFENGKTTFHYELLTCSFFLRVYDSEPDMKKMMTKGWTTLWETNQQINQIYSNLFNSKIIISEPCHLFLLFKTHGGTVPSRKLILVFQAFLVIYNLLVVPLCSQSGMRLMVFHWFLMVFFLNVPSLYKCCNLACLEETPCNSAPLSDSTDIHFSGFWQLWQSKTEKIAQPRSKQYQH